tara:strand:- start:122 stop:556 length:435 start_codon:yes stop_codon:yes gene_type:complete
LIYPGSGLARQKVALIRRFLFHNDGIEIMLKPHIWIRGGFFRGTIAFESDTAWSQFQKSYKEFILHFAQVVQDLKNFSEKVNRSILFTEIGYRSIHRSTVKPWDYSVREQPYNCKAQADVLEAMFLSFQEKKLLGWRVYLEVVS